MLWIINDRHLCIHHHYCESCFHLMSRNFCLSYSLNNCGLNYCQTILNFSLVKSKIWMVKSFYFLKECCNFWFLYLSCGLLVCDAWLNPMKLLTCYLPLLFWHSTRKVVSCSFCYSRVLQLDEHILCSTVAAAKVNSGKF